MPICNVCCVEKTKDKFYKNNTKKGHFVSCKICCKKRTEEKRINKLKEDSLKLIPNKNEVFLKHKIGLLVSNQGRVFREWGVSKKNVSAKFIKPVKNKSGYLVFNFKNKVHYVHRLVADLFCYKEQSNLVVNHKDSIRDNNNSENLEWVTSEYNTKHGVLKDNFSVKLNRSQVLEIRESNLHPKNLAEKYNVTDVNIRLIKSNKIWKHF